MESLISVFGAKASIHLRYEGDLQSLAAKLSSALMLPSFKVGQREDPPYDVMGSLEALGWELWLERTNSGRSFQYSLRMETEHSLEESFNDRMYDLSPWLARYVSSILDVDALVSESRVVFSHGKARELVGE